MRAKMRVGGPSTTKHIVSSRLGGEEVTWAPQEEEAAQCAIGRRPSQQACPRGRGDGRALSRGSRGRRKPRSRRATRGRDCYGLRCRALRRKGIERGSAPKGEPRGGRRRGCKAGTHLLGQRNMKRRPKRDMPRFRKGDMLDRTYV